MPILLPTCSVAYPAAINELLSILYESKNIPPFLWFIGFISGGDAKLWSIMFLDIFLCPPYVMNCGIAWDIPKICPTPDSFKVLFLE